MLQICGGENAISEQRTSRQCRMSKGKKSKRKFSLRKNLFHVVVEVPREPK